MKSPLKYFPIGPPKANHMPAASTAYTYSILLAIQYIYYTFLIIYFLELTSSIYYTYINVTVFINYISMSITKKQNLLIIYRPLILFKALVCLIFLNSEFLWIIIKTTTPAFFFIFLIVIDIINTE